MKRISSYGPGLRAGLKDFIGTEAVSDRQAGWNGDFLKRLEPFVTSGKMLRGSVLCFAYEAFSGRAPDQAVLDAAMALELTHSGLLIHDDIMDDDDKRRGRPSMHHQYELAARQGGLSGGKHFGVSMAMSGGDAVLFMGFELLGRSRSDPELTALFTRQLLRTCAGQMQDVYLEARPVMPTKGEILRLMRYKTASYTLALPLAMGAALAGQGGPVIRRLESVGTAGGTIFQIRDDELGVMGDTRQTGKPVGSDIKEGKKTLLYHYLVKACGPADRDKLDTIFGNPAATGDDIAYVQGLVRHHGIARRLGRDIDGLRGKAYAGIDGLKLSAGSRRELKDLVDFCAKRQY